MRTFALLLTALSAVLTATAASVPRPSPEFVINMTNGSQLLLSQYSGKVVLLAFMFTT